MTLLILAGCATAPRSFQYAPPEGEEGLACVEECKKQTEHCLKQAQEEYELCLRRDVFRDMRHENDCVRGYGATKVGTCQSERLCSPPDSYACRITYNECYTACGGMVEPVK